MMEGNGHAGPGEKSILSGEKVDMCVTVNSADSLRSY